MSKKPFAFCPMCATPLHTTETPAGPRRTCASCRFTHYENPTPVVAAIVQRGDDVILVRNVGWPERWYGLVSGFVERGEVPGDAVLREVREELGVEAELVELVGAYGFEQMNQLIVAYHVRIDGEISPDPAEIADVKLVPIATLRPWPFGTGAAVKDWLERR